MGGNKGDSSDSDKASPSHSHSPSKTGDFFSAMRSTRRAARVTRYLVFPVSLFSPDRRGGGSRAANRGGADGDAVYDQQQQQMQQHYQQQQQQQQPVELQSLARLYTPPIIPPSRRSSLIDIPGDGDGDGSHLNACHDICLDWPSPPLQSHRHLPCHARAWVALAPLCRVAAALRVAAAGGLALAQPRTWDFRGKDSGFQVWV
jgi:hypothetical protein